MTRKYQIWAYFADGEVAFVAYENRARRPSWTSAMACLRQWAKWARGYCKANPGDYPLHKSVAELRANPLRRIVYFCNEPGLPFENYEFYTAGRNAAKAGGV